MLFFFYGFASIKSFILYFSMIKSSSFTNEKPSPILTYTFMIKDSKSNEQNDIQKSRLDKVITKLSSWKILIQCILMTPSFIVPFYFGIKYLGQCPIQPLINTYMIIHACLNLANILFIFMSFLTAQCVQRSAAGCSFYARYLFISSLIGQLLVFVVSFAWIIIGLVWILQSRSNGFQSTDPSQTDTYCNGTLFWNALASVIITFVIWFILILVVIGRLVVKRWKAKSNYDEC